MTCSPAVGIAWKACRVAAAQAVGGKPNLIAFTEPVIVAQHVWSGFSRHALWALATSSWASQFASIGHQLGDEGHAVRVARAMFSLAPEIERAVPRLTSTNADCARTARSFQRQSDPNKTGLGLPHNKNNASPLKERGGDGCAGD